MLWFFKPRVILRPSTHSFTTGLKWNYSFAGIIQLLCLFSGSRTVSQLSALGPSGLHLTGGHRHPPCACGFHSALSEHHRRERRRPVHRLL